MKWSIVNKLNQKRTSGFLNRNEIPDTQIVAAPQMMGSGLPDDYEGSVERQEEMRFALQELRDLVLEGESFEMVPGTHPGADSEMATFLE